MVPQPHQSPASSIQIPPVTVMFQRWDGHTPVAKWMRKRMLIRNPMVTQPIGEFLGTFVLCLFTVGASAQHQLMPGESHFMPIYGSAAGLLIAIVSFGGASGAHVNPVVTLGLAMAGDLAWVKVPYYCIAQMAGAYLGAGVAFAIYEHRLCLEGGQVCVEAVGIFSPLPSSPVSVGMLDQIVTVSVLMIFVFAIADKRNMKVDRGLFGIYFALAVCGISVSFGLNAGAVLNPARDLGPRLMAVSLGHSFESLFYYKNEPYWLVPLLGPLIGGILGTFIYLMFVGSQLEPEDETRSLKSIDTTSIDVEANWKSAMIRPRVKAIFPKDLISRVSSSSHTYPYALSNCLNDFDNYGFCLEEDQRRHEVY